MRTNSRVIPAAVPIRPANGSAPDQAAALALAKALRVAEVGAPLSAAIAPGRPAPRRARACVTLFAGSPIWEGCGFVAVEDSAAAAGPVSQSGRSGSSGTPGGLAPSGGRARGMILLRSLRPINIYVSPCSSPEPTIVRSALFKAWGVLLTNWSRSTNF
jgi:hypothetical protein